MTRSHASRALRPLYLTIPLLGMSACFGFTSPKGAPSTGGSTTGSTAGSTTGALSDFTQDTLLTNAALIDFDPALVEVTTAAKLKPAQRFLLGATSNAEVITAGAELTETEVKDSAFQVKTLSPSQRRSEAFQGFSPQPYMALTLDAAPYADSFGNNNGGTCGGVVCPSSTAGVIGNGLRFGTTTTDAISITNPADLPANRSDRVMCAWAKPNVVDGNDLNYHYLISYGIPQGNKTFALGVIRPAMGEALQLVLSTYGFESFRVTGLTAANALSGEWVHLCASFVDPDSAGGGLGIFALWINGVLAQSWTENTAPENISGDMGDPDGILTKGFVGNMTTETERWLGDLDEPVIFSPASPTMASVGTQIAQIYRNTQTKVVYQKEGNLTSPVFDAATPWPWSAVVVGVEAPYSNKFGPSETGFGELGYNSDGNNLLLLMDEDSNPMPDRSGQGHDASCISTQCPSIDPDLQLAQFSPTDNDRMYVENADSFLPSVRSICVKAALDDSAFDERINYSTVLSLGKDGNQLDITSVDGQLFVDQFGSIASATRPVFDAASELNGSHSVCVTRDGTTMRVYLDGEELMTAVQSGSFATTGNVFFIGQRIQFGLDDWNGTISMVGTWSRVLSLAEIRGLHLRGQLSIGMRYGTASTGAPDPILGPSGPSTSYLLADGAPGIYSYTIALPTSLTPQPRFRARVGINIFQPTVTPRITSIEALPAKLPATALVTQKTATPYTVLSGFTAEVAPGTTGELKYRLLKGSEILFWNGNAWAAAGPTDGSSAVDVNAHLGDFVSAKGAGEVKWQALLSSINLRNPVGLLRVTLTGLR